MVRLEPSQPAWLRLLARAVFSCFSHPSLKEQVGSPKADQAEASAQGLLLLQHETAGFTGSQSQRHSPE